MAGDHKKAQELNQNALEILTAKNKIENEKNNIYIAICLYNLAIESVHMNLKNEAQGYVGQAYAVAQAHLKNLPLVHTKVVWLFKELHESSPVKHDTLPRIERQPSINLNINPSETGKSNVFKESLKGSPNVHQPQAKPYLFKMNNPVINQESKPYGERPTTGSAEKRIGKDLLISDPKKPRPISANKHNLFDAESSIKLIKNEKPQILSLKEKIRIRSKKEKARNRIEPIKKSLFEQDLILKSRINAAKKIQNK